MSHVVANGLVLFICLIAITVHYLWCQHDDVGFLIVAGLLLMALYFVVLASSNTKSGIFEAFDSQGELFKLPRLGSDIYNIVSPKLDHLLTALRGPSMDNLDDEGNEKPSVDNVALDGLEDRERIVILNNFLLYLKMFNEAAYYRLYSRSSSNTAS